MIFKRFLSFHYEVHCTPRALPQDDYAIPQGASRAKQSVEYGCRVAPILAVTLDVKFFLFATTYS
jgi:hypothetical protein